MDRFRTGLADLLSSMAAWFDTHRDLGGQYLAPACLVLSFLTGFWFLLKALGMV